MKRAILFFGLIIVVMFTSCTREYICQCTVSYSGHLPGLPDTTVNEYLIKNTHKNAMTICKEHSNISTENGVTYTEACQLY